MEARNKANAYKSALRKAKEIDKKIIHEGSRNTI